MTIEQGPDDAPVDHARERVVMRFWSKHSHQLLALAVRIDLQTMGVGGAAPVANRRGSVGALNTLRGSHAGRWRRGAFQMCAYHH